MAWGDGCAGQAFNVRGEYAASPSFLTETEGATMTEPIYDSRDPRCKSPYGAAASGPLVLLTLRPPRQEGLFPRPAHRAVRGRGGRGPHPPMPWSGLDGDRDQFSCVLDTGGYVGLVWYTFTLERLDGKKSQQLGPYQLTVYDGGEGGPSLVWRGNDLSDLPRPLPPHPDPGSRRDGGGGGSTPLGRRSRSTARTGTVRSATGTFSAETCGCNGKAGLSPQFGVTTLYFCPVLRRQRITAMAQPITAESIPCWAVRSTFPLSARRPTAWECG